MAIKFVITQDLVDNGNLPTHLKPGGLRVILDARADRERIIFYAFGSGGRVDEEQLANIDEKFKDAIEFAKGNIDADTLLSDYGEVVEELKIKALSDLEQFF